MIDKALKCVYNAYVKFAFASNRNIFLMQEGGKVMSDSAKIKVSVTREVPYDRLTVTEKVKLAEHTNENELLVALATDKSAKVRKSLLTRRVFSLPNEILGEYLLNDENEEVRNLASYRINYLLDNYFGVTFGKRYEKLLVFLCLFFSSDFISTLDTIDGKKKAMAAIYLYDMKYGFRPKKTCMFEYEFVNKYSRSYLDKYYERLGAQTSYAPWSIEVWLAVGRVSIYKYFMAEVQTLLQTQNYFSNDEVLDIVWFKEIAKSDSSDNWIEILANTLFNTGSLDCGDSLEREYQVLYLKVKSGYSLDDILRAQDDLKYYYKTSCIPTCYNK